VSGAPADVHASTTSPRSAASTTLRVSGGAKASTKA
jgi:hypothetical protein